MKLITDALVLIPARKGSKGLPGKNIKLLNGKPLISYTIEAALEVFARENICISTDDPKVIEISKSLGLEVPFVRPEYLASDTASTEAVLMHALEFYNNIGKKFNSVVLLQPTSPLRRSLHISQAYQLYLNGNADIIVSAYETKSNPYYVLYEEKEGYLTKSKEGDFIRRQDCPTIWELNGAIYIYDTDKLISNGLSNMNRKVVYAMDKNSSFDIDDELDFFIVEQILKNNLAKRNI